MYEGGRPGAAARRSKRLDEFVAASGLLGWWCVRLVEVLADRRPPILKAYLRRAPGACPHVPVDKDAPLPAFEAIAADFPVFEGLPR